MNLEFRKENIEYLDLLGKSLLFSFKDLDVESMMFTYKDKSTAEFMLLSFADKYDLVKSDYRDTTYYQKKV